MVDADTQTVAGSFRDPAGFLFRRAGRLYRQVNQAGAADYDRLMSSGLYDRLVKAGRLIPHVESGEPPAVAGAHLVIQPEPVPFVSYPYEWSFGQLKAAALATLEIQRQALELGQMLKDASAYNIQFIGPRPVLIDTLSFTAWEEGRPWVAYRQFCQHFLAPLALAAQTDIRLIGSLLRRFIDGVPLDLAAALLPGRTKFAPGLLAHLHLHAKSQARYADKAVDVKQKAARMSRAAMLGLVDNLTKTVDKLTWRPAGTEWAEYYDMGSYTEAGQAYKAGLVERFIRRAGPAAVWDLGANTGLFSRLAVKVGAGVVSFDYDPAAVEKNYRQAVEEKQTALLPLVMDLTNPSPALGWAHQERRSLIDRGPVDLVMALALIHHLAISNHVPFDRLADFFAGLGDWLIIEFVGPDDHQVKKLTANRFDDLSWYNQADFEAAFGRVFGIVEKEPVAESARTLYLLAKKKG